MKNISKKFNIGIGGFSIVEIITTTAIIAVLAIIGFTFSSNYKSNQYNTSRISDLTAIYNTLQTYYVENKTYPDPSGNKQYYDKYGTYSHGIDGAFGISGFLTQKTLSKNKLGYPFKDEQTKNYYGYGKRLDGNSGYNLATVLNEKGEYFSYVAGDIGGNRMELAGLVKEYAGPNFVTNKSKYLPYNPYEIKLTGKISVYSGAVIIKDNNSNTITSNILDYEIEKGNIVKVGTGGLATINLSDGTELRLGSLFKESILDFTNLEYKDNNNLLTKVMLNLSLGEIWVKAPQLEEDSSFEVTNTFAAASVRGTIFGMISNTSSGTISLIQGKIKVGKIKSRTDEDVVTAPFFTTTNIGSGFIYDSSTNSSYLEVLNSNKPVSLDYIETTLNPDKTTSDLFATGTVLDSKIIEVKTPQLKLNSGIIPSISSIIKNTSGNLNFAIENIGADYIEIIGDLNGVQKDFYSTGITNPSSFSGVFNIPLNGGSTNFSIKLCKTIIEGKMVCTGQFKQKTAGLSMNESTLIDFKKNASNFNSLCEKGKKTFKNYGCQSEDLVSYSPYNEYGDVYMYTKNGDLLGFETISVISRSLILAPYTKLEKIKELKDNLFIKIGDLSYIPYFNTTNLIFSTSSPTTTNFITALGLKEYKKETSFMSYPGGNGAIFIDNSNDGYTNDYIKYDISKLNLKDKFSIEMSVRGAALKRSSLGKNFTLFDFGGNNNKLILNTNKDFNKLILLINGVEKNIPISGFINLDLNKFYKVIASFEGDNFNLKVIGDGFEKTAIGRDSTLLNKDWIYIGSTSVPDSQWNDIIDYVKIYKN